MKLSFVKDSVLKQKVLDSSVLPTSEKYNVAEGATLEILDIGLAGQGHFYIKLVNAIEGRTNWYVFSNHVNVLDSTGNIISVKEKDVTSHNQVQATKIPDYSKSMVKKGVVVDIIGIGKVGLLDSIIPDGNFTWSEATHSGTRLPQCSEHADAMVRMATEIEKVRKVIGKPLHITSWYRPEPYNANAGGARNSQHLTGGAADFYVDGLSSDDIKYLIDDMWEGGLGTYANLPDIVHLDVRGYRARW